MTVDGRDREHRSDVRRSGGRVGERVRAHGVSAGGRCASARLTGQFRNGRSLRAGGAGRALGSFCGPCEPAGPGEACEPGGPVGPVSGGSTSNLAGAWLCGIATPAVQRAGTTNVVPAVALAGTFSAPARNPNVSSEAVVVCTSAPDVEYNASCAAVDLNGLSSGHAVTDLTPLRSPPDPAPARSRTSATTQSAQARPPDR